MHLNLKKGALENILNRYSINISSLQNKAYQYQFDIDDSFFSVFENSLIEKGSLALRLSLEKSETMIQLNFDIEGTVLLVCDRSLEEFDFPINTSEKLILQFGEHSEQINDELEIIPRTSVSINIARPAYELISIAIPMKKLHPKFQEEDDDDNDVILVYSSENLQNQSEEDLTIDETDPRWQALNKLKGDN